MNIDRERYNGIGINAGDSAKAADIRRIISETKIVNAIQTLIEVANSGYLHSFKLRLCIDDNDNEDEVWRLR